VTTLLFHQHRDYEWQLLHEQAEREDMFNEEMDQTELDRYWGIDFYVTMQNKEETRLRQVYQEKVDHLNAMMVTMKTVKPPRKHYSFAHVGSLPEDSKYESETERRIAVIRRLKAEEFRGKLKLRLKVDYS
jgi:hypothetical protein